jgi:hypothetical protein
LPLNLRLKEGKQRASPDISRTVSRHLCSAAVGTTGIRSITVIFQFFQSLPPGIEVMFQDFGRWKSISCDFPEPVPGKFHCLCIELKKVPGAPTTHTISLI